MATRYWIASAGGSRWNDTGNWSTSSGGSGGASVPNAGDTAIFDGNGLADCRMDVALTSDVVITTNSGYTGDVDASVDDLNHSVGNVTFNDGTASLGDGTWTCSGDWLFPGGTWTRNASTVVMTGTGKTLGITSNFDSLTVSGSVTTSGVVGAALADVVVSGTLTIASGDTFTISGSGASLEVTTTGTVTGDGVLRFQNGPTFTIGASASFSGLGEIEALNSFSFPSFDYSGVTLITMRASTAGTQTVTMGSGTFTFNDLELQTTGSGRTLAVTCSTNNPSFVIKGDVVTNISSGSNHTWTAGTGTITANGTAAQDWAWFDADMSAIQTIEDVTINKSSGTLTLSSDMKTQSFTGTDGDLDMGGNSIETTGAFTISAGFTLNLTGLAGADWTVGGNFDITGTGAGSELDLRAGSAWTIDVTGTADADYVRVSNSDASAGTTITATNSYDHGNNTNWSGLASVFNSSWASNSNVILGAGVL